MFLSLVFKLQDYRILVWAHTLVIILIGGGLFALEFCIKTILLTHSRQQTVMDLQSKNALG